MAQWSQTGAWRPPDAGKLRTVVRIMMRFPETDTQGKPLTDEDGYPIEREVNVFGPGQTRRVWWRNAWGVELYQARQAGVTAPAILTLRYSPAVTPQCLVYRQGEEEPWEILGVDDIENAHAWLQVRCQRRERTK